MWFSFFITWEQRKLGELSEKFADGDWIEAKDQSSSGIRLIQTGNIGLGEYLDKPNNKKWVSEDTFNRLHCEEVLAGDILISRLPEPAGRACIVPNLGTKMITAVDCTIVRTSANVSKKFLLQHLSSKKYFNEVNTCMAGGTRQRISRSNLANFNVLVPISFDEQESIGGILCGLDNLITLHQRKQKDLFFLILSKNLSLILANDWEQRKFGEYFEERNERSGEGELISVTINSGIKKFNELGRFDTKPEDLSKYKRVEVGDIAYNSMRMWQGASGYSPYSGILSPAYTVISPKTGVSSLFFAYLIKRPQMIHLFEINSQGLTSDTWNLKFPAFSQIEASAPTDIAEQKNIAEIFTVLDNLITLHQCKRAAFFDWQRWLYSKFEESKITLAWEQCKFESLAETRRGLTYNPSNISPHGIRVLRSSNINEDTFVLSYDDVFVRPDAVKIECVKPNDILITAANGSTRLVGKHAIIVGIRENEAVHGGFMLVASSSMPFFLNAAMSAPWYLKFINLFVAGGNGAIGNLNKNDLDNQLLFVPKNAEQEQIGEFFRNLDNLITLHQRGEKINNRRQT